MISNDWIKNYEFRLGGFPFYQYQYYSCWYSNAINHPPFITIFMGGIPTIQKWAAYGIAIPTLLPSIDLPIVSRLLILRQELFRGQFHQTAAVGPAVWRPVHGAWHPQKVGREPELLMGNWWEFDGNLEFHRKIEVSMRQTRWSASEMRCVPNKIGDWCFLTFWNKE